MCCGWTLRPWGKRSAQPRAPAAPICRPPCASRGRSPRYRGGTGGDADLLEHDLAAHADVGVVQHRREPAEGEDAQKEYDPLLDFMFPSRFVVAEIVEPMFFLAGFTWLVSELSLT